MWKKSHKPKFSEVEELESLLDSKLNRISIESVDSFLLVTRFPGTSWGLKCERELSSSPSKFACIANAEKLKILFYGITAVS